MALSDRDKGAIVLMIGSLGFAFIIPMILYLRYLLDHRILTWQNFIHAHWIGIAGIVAISVYVICATACVHLTLLDRK